jgi:hypothetical protein
VTSLPAALNINCKITEAKIIKKGFDSGCLRDSDVLKMNREKIMTV